MYDTIKHKKKVLTVDNKQQGLDQKRSLGEKNYPKALRNDAGDYEGIAKCVQKGG